MLINKCIKLLDSIEAKMINSRSDLPGWVAVLQDEFVKPVKIIVYGSKIWGFDFIKWAVLSVIGIFLVNLIFGSDIPASSYGALISACVFGALFLVLFVSPTNYALRQVDGDLITTAVEVLTQQDTTTAEAQIIENKINLLEAKSKRRVILLRIVLASMWTFGIYQYQNLFNNIDLTLSPELFKREIVEFGSYITLWVVAVVCTESYATAKSVFFTSASFGCSEIILKQD